MRDCIFCAIIRGAIPSHKVYEDEHSLVFLDVNPSAPGHTLVIPKRHEARLENLPEPDAVALFKALHRVVGGVQAAMGAPATTIGINNGPEAGQEIPHIHIHVIPRSRRDRGGMIQAIIRSDGRPTSQKLGEIAERIRLAIG